jgi:hypothetical protein
MKKNILLPLLFLLAAFNAYSQTTRSSYSDFVIVTDRLWALTGNGHLRLFDLAQAKRVGDPPFEDSLTTITKDIHSAIVVGDKHHRIERYDTSTDSWALLGNYSGTLYGITFDHANTCYLITSNGIVELGTKQSYLPDSGRNSQIRYHGKWFRQPAYFMDEQDILWVGFRYGEWGGDLFVFDTHLKRFLPLNLNGFDVELNPVQCICTDGGDIFISTGLDHFTTSGSIIRVKNYKVSIILDSSPYSDAHRKDTSFDGEYIGPAYFKKADHCLYFYSQHGFFRGDPDKDLSSIEKWEKIAQPRLKWSSGQRDAVGSPMNVLKLGFYQDSRIVFLTELNGIGLIQDDHVVFLK